MAARILLSRLRGIGYARSRYEGPTDLPSLPTSVQRDGRNDLRQDAHTPARVVRCGVVSHQSETRCQCPGTATGAGPDQLPDRLGDIAPVSACDGAPGPGLVERDGGGGRSVPGVEAGGQSQAPRSLGAHFRGRLTVPPPGILAPPAPPLPA